MVLRIILVFNFCSFNLVCIFILAIKISNGPSSVNGINPVGRPKRSLDEIDAESHLSISIPPLEPGESKASADNHSG